MATMTKKMAVDWASIPKDALMKVDSQQMFQQMYMQNPNPPERRGERDGRYKLSDAEHWLLQAFAIQNMDVEQDEFDLSLVHPDHVPLEYMLHRGIHVQYERGTDTFVVWEVATEDEVIGHIKTTVGMWDTRNRIRFLWSEDEADRQDPADVLSDGADKWINVRERKGRDGRGYESHRAPRTNYKEAGGLYLDQRALKTSLSGSGPNDYHNASIDSRTQWRETRQMHYDAHMAFDKNGKSLYHRPQHRESSVMERETLDRAHADEMMGPARGEKE